MSKELKMDAALMTPADDTVHTSFSGLPEGLVDVLRAEATRRGFDTLQEICDEVATDFCDDLDAGLKVESWPHTAPGTGSTRVTIRFTDAVLNRLKTLSSSHRVRQGAFFTAAARRWLRKHNVNFEEK
jgi:hypothetical protein